MATQELVTQLNPEHYDNLTDANATGKTNFGKSSCQNNTGTVFAVGSDDNVVIYTSNSYQTKYATSISNPGNSNSLFGFKIALDSPGDTIIIGAPGDNRVYVFDAQNQARTSWTQRSSGWNNNSYLGTSDSGTIHYGSDVDVAGDDDSLFVVGRPGDHKIELWSWSNGSSATLLKTITKSSNFGFSCKLSADGQVVIAGGPGNYYPSGTNNGYGNGIAHVYAKDPSSATTWTERTLPFDYTDCSNFRFFYEAGTTTVKHVPIAHWYAFDGGGSITYLYPAFGYSVAINKDGTFIAVSAPNRRCFLAAEWVNDSSYNWLTGKPITGEINSFGSYLFMQYDGTRIITGNTNIEDRMYWEADGSFPGWRSLNNSSSSYCVLDWNGIYYTNYSETFNQYSFGGVPTSISKNGEFALFSTKYDSGFVGNEARVTGSNRTLYTGNTVFSLTRFAPTIKILGTTTIGGDLKVRFLSVGGDKSYLSSNTSTGFVPGYINFENTRDEHSIFRSQIINTSQYTGDDNLSELLLFKSGHVRGLNSRGPDRIRLKSPSIILEGMTSENHPLHVPTPDSIGPVAESWSRYLKEASAVYSRLTLTGIGNVGIGIPEYADHIIKENWNLGSSPVLGNSDYYKQNENANAQAPPLINHRLVIDGTQSIQNGKLYINNPTSSNLITDGMATCYNTMTSACIQNTNSTNIPYVICDSMKRNPYWSDEDGYNNYYDRLRLYNTVTYDDVNKGLYFGTSASYAQGWTQSTRDTITGNVVNVLSGVYTTSYWFMLKDYAQSTFGSNGKLIFTAFHYTSLGYGHKITDTGFKVQYTRGRAIGGQPYYTSAVSDYTVNYTFNQNVWYHVCVKVDNTAGNGANEGTATTQLWINGVSQSLTANETNRDMNGRFPGFCWFGVVNQASSGTYGHTLGGDGMYGHLIGNVKIYIAHDGTDYFERVAVPDYNTGPDFYNEGPPNEGLSVLGGVNISGGLRANGSSGTSGQVLTSSGGGAMSWTTVSGGGGGSSPWTTSGSDIIYNTGNVRIGSYITHDGDTNTYFGFPSDDTFIIKTNGTERLRANSSGNIGIGTASPGYKLDVIGDINMSSGSSLRINGVAQSFGGGGGSSLSGTNTFEWGTGVSGKETNAGKIGYSTFTSGSNGALDIVGAGTGTTNRNVRIFDHLGIGTGSPEAYLHVKREGSSGESNVYIQAYSDSTGDRAALFLGTPHSSSTTSQPKCAIIADAVGWSRADLHFCLETSQDNGSAYRASTSNSRMMIDGISGNVGIGTTTPGAVLEVNGTSTVNSYSSAIRRFFNAGGVNFSSSVGSWGNFSIRASGSIGTSGYFVAHSGTWQASDSRIKTNINDVTDASALEKLRLLEPKTYTYIDTNEQGDTTVYGFIAQEVSNVFPEAVKISENVIPNIYELSNVSDSNVITFTNFNTSDLLTSNVTSKIHVRSVYDKVERLTLDEVIDAKSIRVKEDLTNMIGSVDDTGNVVSGNQVFVMGQEVDNFNILKKEYIFTIATAALQEVDRQLQAEKTKVSTLETQVADLLARVTALENN